MTAALRLFVPGGEPAGATPACGGPGGRLSAAMRLTEIYHGYIEPVVQVGKDARPRNLESLRCSLAYWARFTGDPPLAEIDEVEHGLLFVTGLRTLPGKRSPQISANSVAKHVAAVQAMLDLCGPRDRMRRDALGLVARAPYLQRPRKTKKPVDDAYTLEEIELLLANCAAARLPNKLSIPPRTYWERLLVAAFNTGMRVGELMLASVEHDRRTHLELPPRLVAKGYAGRSVALNGPARAIFDAMREVRDVGGAAYARFFMWPWNWEASRGEFYEQYQLIRACLPVHRQKWMAIHSFRKATGTELGKINALAAQKQLGHSTARMTSDHYTAETAKQTALAQLPQPRWRRDVQRRLFE